MSKVVDILRQNAELKQQIEDILSLVKENDIKHWGYKVIEYAFLNAKTLEEIDCGPLSYIEEIFDIDHVYLLINQDVLSYVFMDKKYDRIVFYNRKAFEYFFFAKKPYIGYGHANLTKEFDLFENSLSYLIIPVIHNDTIIASLNFYSLDKNKFAGDFALDFVKDLSIKVAFILQGMNKISMLEHKLSKEMPVEEALFEDEKRLSCYNLFIIKFSLSPNPDGLYNVSNMIKLMKGLRQELFTVKNVDYIFQPFLDTVYILSAEIAKKKLQCIIKECSKKINDYLLSKEVKLIYSIELESNGEKK